MSRIKTIIQGFVDINLETDENSFMKVSEEKILEIQQINLSNSEKEKKLSDLSSDQKEKK